MDDDRGSSPFRYEAIRDFTRAGGVAERVGVRWEDMWTSPISDEEVSIATIAQGFCVVANVPADEAGAASVGRLLQGDASVILTERRLIGLLFDGVFGDTRRVDMDRGSAVAFSAPLEEVGYVSLQVRRGLLGGQKGGAITVGLRYGPVMQNGALLVFHPIREHLAGRRHRRLEPRAVADRIVAAAIATQLPGAAGARLDALRRAAAAGWAQDGHDAVLRDLWGETALGDDGAP